MKNRDKIHWPALILIIVGCLQFGGYAFNSRVLRGIGFSYGVSPRPTVFSTVEGVEGFDTQHWLHYVNVKGDTVLLPLDQQRYRELTGSFWLKNAYSIFLAYPHMLKPTQIEAGADYWLCQHRIRDFGIMDIKECLGIESTRRVNGRTENRILQSNCKQGD